MESEVDAHSASAEIEKGAFLLDVRENDEYVAGHIPNSVLIPTSELADRFDEVPKDVDVYVVCRSGTRSRLVTAVLNGKGYSAANITGGVLDWRAVGLPFVTDTGEEATVI